MHGNTATQRHGVTWRGRCAPAVAPAVSWPAWSGRGGRRLRPAPRERRPGPREHRPPPALPLGAGKPGRVSGSSALQPRVCRETRDLCTAPSRRRPVPRFRLWGLLFGSETLRPVHVCPACTVAASPATASQAQGARAVGRRGGRCTPRDRANRPGLHLTHVCVTLSLRVLQSEQDPVADAHTSHAPLPLVHSPPGSAPQQMAPCYRGRSCVPTSPSAGSLSDTAGPSCCCTLQGVGQITTRAHHYSTTPSPSSARKAPAAPVPSSCPQLLS